MKHANEQTEEMMLRTDVWLASMIRFGRDVHIFKELQ